MDWGLPGARHAHPAHASVALLCPKPQWRSSLTSSAEVLSRDGEPLRGEPPTRRSAPADHGPNFLPVIIGGRTRGRGRWRDWMDRAVGEAAPRAAWSCASETRDMRLDEVGEFGVLAELGRWRSSPALASGLPTMAQPLPLVCSISV